jgi:hypothetical protein
MDDEKIKETQMKHGIRFSSGNLSRGIARLETPWKHVKGVSKVFPPF